ncbi:hypothetical protein C8Q78DRAFT_1085033 [Trametes maxima]|nr:hypothetical protein C8Q78DRAFT_1085033 [Trametes maxima]
MSDHSTNCNPHSADGMLQDEINAWFERNPGPSNDVGASPDEFDEDIDQRSCNMASMSDDPLGFINTEIDWRTMFRDALTLGASVGTPSAHSDWSSTVIPESPASITSEETAFNPSATFSPGDNHANVGEKVYTSTSTHMPVGGQQNGSTFGFNPVVGNFYIYSTETPPAHSLDVERFVRVQAQQQRPFGAVDASASRDTLMSLPAGGPHPSLTIQQTSVPALEGAHGERPAYDGNSNEPATQLPSASTKKYFICPICGRVMSLKFNMNVHIDDVHMDIRNHRCSAPGCDKAYHRKGDLKKHFQKYPDHGPPHCGDPEMHPRFTRSSFITSLESLAH